MKSPHSARDGIAAAPSILHGPARPDLLRPETLVDVFRASAARTPGALAIRRIGSTEALTYAELDTRSDRVAGALVRLGVRPGSFVGLWLQRSLDLHVALLGILKAGAAFLPFDADTPADRVGAALADAGAAFLVTHRPQAGRAAGIATMPALVEELAAAPTERASLPPCDPGAAAYAIYTSGSTGKPKGIVVGHAAICHYLRAANLFLEIGPDDVVLQQASVAFDLAMEEIFVPYLAGASLRLADAAILRDIDRLPEVLEAEGVTVIDTVPTLMAMLPRDVAGLRTVILGGEACPPGLAERLLRPGRRVFNTYGPTETTVVATFAELRPGEPVTIGGPIANTCAVVVDETFRPVPRGATGELVIGGPGVAQGYLGLARLTAEKFVVAGDPRMPEGRLYRTGDAASLDDAGRIVFHGRIDDQVKLRGFRIELGEIESLLLAEPGVRAAAVAVHGTGGGEALVAHVVSEGALFDGAAARRSLARQVPAYMVPSRWELRDGLPTLPSGKVDRKALAAMPLSATGGSEDLEQEPPRSRTEAQLLKAALTVFGLPTIGFEADFFDDLGGQSMLAARFVSEVRRTPALAGIAMRDIYTHRTLRALATALDAGRRAAAGEPDLRFTPVPLSRRFFCGLAQAAALPFIVGIASLQWIGLLLSSMLLLGDDATLLQDIGVLTGVYCLLNLGTKALVVVLKWAVIGRTRPGVYPLWGVYYFRLWVVQRIVQLTCVKFLKGSPLMRLYLNALGARIGRDAILEDFEEGAVDLLHVGPRASLGSKVKFANIEVIGNQVHVGLIDIGADAAIGNGSVICGDTVIGDGAEIGDLTMIAAGARIAPRTRWEGTPAREIGPAEAGEPEPHPELGMPARVMRGFGFFLFYNVAMAIGLLPIFPAFMLMETVYDRISADGADLSWGAVAAMALPAAVVLVVGSMALVVALRWLLLPRRVQPGSWSVFSPTYFRQWIVGVTTESILETLNSLYATIFMRNWYRLMGARIGRGTEISASFSGRYDLIEMGENCFIGDEAVFGDEEIRNGRMVLRRVKVGDRCFFGNSSVIAQGCRLGDDVLIGIKTRLPDGLAVESGRGYVGSPPMHLPARQKIHADARATYDPPLRMVLLRIAFEALHTALPTAVLIFAAYVAADTLAAWLDGGSWLGALAIFLLAGLVSAGAMYLMALAVKWLLIGTYRPIMKPMWSWWAMRTEAVAVVFGGLASKMLLDFLRGTPFLPWLLRPFGVRIGRGVWLNTTDFCEFDCTEIGDHAVLNMNSCPQTHLYEDRIMKVGRIRIGAGATVGSGSTVLYDTEIGSYAQIRPLTLIMKGEAIPTATAWCGSPAQAVVTATAVPARPEALPAAAE